MLTIAGGIIIAVVALVLWRVIAIGAAAVLGVALVLVVGYGLATAGWAMVAVVMLWALLTWGAVKWRHAYLMAHDAEYAQFNS